jgi:glycosyltransferase involved in cell wall biosynthesis
MITVSRFARDEIVELYRWPASRISVTPLGLPSVFLKERSSPEHRRQTLERLGLRPPYVLNVGGYESHKNVLGLIEAFARLRRPSLMLAIAGSGNPPASTTDAIQRLNLTNSVVLLSSLGENLLDVYDGAAAFATLSWRESFGLPALEAMSRGVPVVASAWGAAPEVVGEYGKLVDPRDTESAAAAIAAILDSSTDPDVLRSHARTFHWRHTAELTATVYRELLTRRHRRYGIVR